jgi:hypothetical protein
MRRPFLALQLPLAAASTFNVVSFRLQALMAPQSAELDRLAAGALAAIVLLCVGMIVISRYAGALRGLSAGVGTRRARRRSRCCARRSPGRSSISTHRCRVGA